MLTLNEPCPAEGTVMALGSALSWKSCVGITTKETREVRVPAEVVTAIGPVVAAVGTVTVSEVRLFTVKPEAATPSKLTTITLSLRLLDFWREH